MEQTPTPTPAPGTTPTRRGVLRASLWSVPVVAVATSAPAYASSTPTYAIQPNGAAAPVEAVQCQPVPAGTVTFTAVTVGTDLKGAGPVTVTLPAGLRFRDGSQAASVQPDTLGVVLVPEFTATGAAGTYTVTATYHGQQAFATVLVGAAPGIVVELRRSATTSATQASFATVAVGTSATLSTAVAGAIAGDQSVTSGSSTGANGAVLTSDGRVRLWGATVGGAAASPGSLAHEGKELTGLAMIDTWTSRAASGTLWAHEAGGVAADGSRVFVWSRSATTPGAPTVHRVTGLSGTVLRVHAEEGWSHALTTAGVYAWASRATATPVAVLVTGTRGATHLSTWGHHAPTAQAHLRTGGAAVVGGTLVTWSQATSSDAGTSSPSWAPTLTTSALPAGVTATSLVASDSGLMVLDTAGRLWSHGLHNSPAWVQRASNVAAFSMWGYRTNLPYLGGTWIDVTGRVTQFFNDARWHTPTEVRTPSGALVGVTKVFASDGTYLSLSADGTVHAWGGNLDNPGRTPAQRVAAVTGGPTTVVDLDVWGHHETYSPSNQYTGGGYVIRRGATC